MLNRAIIILGVVLGCIRSLAAGVVPLDAATSGQSLTPFLSFYRDISGQMTLTQIQEPWKTGQFSLAAPGIPSFGFTQDTLWAGFGVHHQGTVPAMWVVQLHTPRLDSVEAYLVRSSGPIEQFTPGDLRTADPKLVDTVSPSFPFLLQPGEHAEFFLRVRSETSLQLPLGVYSAKHHAAAQTREVMFRAGFLGYLSALIIIGFVYGMICRERGMAVYSMSLLGIFITYFILSGYWAWLGLPARSVAAKQGLMLTFGFALFMMVLFLRRLLDLAVTMPRVDRWAARVMWSGAAATLFFLLLPYRIGFPLSLCHLLLVGVLLVLTALAAWHRGIQVAKFYAVAWLVYWASYGASIVPFLARKPMAHLPIAYGLAGAAMACTLFLLAIAYRVREIRQTACKAQMDLLTIERQAGAEMRRRMHQEQLLIRDLHDGIGGLTANLAILAELGRRSSVGNQEQENFSRISRLASEGSLEIRTLMKSLEAREMSWPDFFDELRQHGQALLRPHGIEFSLIETGLADHLGPGVYVGLSLMRLLKEAMNNAVKHAACSRVTVTAEFTQNHLRLSVRDNGRGMLPSAKVTGRGLKNMSTRIQEVDGCMSCHGEDGFELLFELPLPIRYSEQSSRTPGPDRVTSGVITQNLPRAGMTGQETH